jgi:hypothetical protein
VKELLPLTADQLVHAEERLRHPAPGGRIESAKRFGVDLTLLIEQLRLTPAERAQKLDSAATALEHVRGAARRRC